MPTNRKKAFSDLRPKHPDTRAPQGIRTFTICRPKDETGVSGVGIVLEGVIFATGQCILHWLTPTPKGSISIFEGLDDFLKIHVKPHPENKTILTFDDGETIRFDYLEDIEREG